MPYSIALAGKGGTGKTTTAGMLIKYLLKKNKTPILAVDADCNANLNEVLGVNISDTLGNAREEMKRGDVLLFNSFLLHTSNINFSNLIRYSIQIRFTSEDLGKPSRIMGKLYDF